MIFTMYNDMKSIMMFYDLYIHYRSLFAGFFNQFLPSASDYFYFSVNIPGDTLFPWRSFGLVAPVENN